MDIIKFGTDGWRAKIGKGFTFENLARVVDAYAVYLKRKRAKTIAAGYDNRFLSDKYCAFAAERLASYGFKVYTFGEAVHTPLVSFAVKERNLDSGIMITASHNPYEYNGFKIKNRHGAGASPAETAAVEKLIRQGKKPAGKKGGVHVIDMAQAYTAALRRIVNTDIIKKSSMKIVVDYMYGSAAGCFERALGGYKNIIAINNRRDPFFGGINPEPVRKNLLSLEAAVKKHRADIGLAVDGDGDRMAMVSDRGQYITTHKALVGLMFYHLKHRKEKFKFAKTVSGTSLLDRMAREYSVPIITTPVGFKHIAGIMIKDKTVIGGEESGGMGFGYFVPERDGILTGLIILELLAREGVKISGFLNRLDKKYGEYIYDRADTFFPKKDREDILGRVRAVEKKGVIAGKRIIQTDKTDGIKYVISDREWLLFRFSGTEPLLRIYSEGPSKKEVKDNLAFGRKTAGM